MIGRRLYSWESFGRLLRSWVVKVLEAFLQKYIRAPLGPDHRSPVLGRIGIGIGREVGEDTAEYTPAYVGFYGIPTPNTAPSSDEGVLWNGGGLTWTAQDAQTWAPTFPVPDGLRVGNVSHENTVGDLVSWMWHFAGDSSETSSTKYCLDGADFHSWIKTVQEGGSTDVTLGHVYNRGYLMITLPGGYACIGACVRVATSYLLAVGMDTSAGGISWEESGFTVYASYNNTDFSILSFGSPLNFGVGDNLRINGEVREVVGVADDPPYFTDVSVTPGFSSAPSGGDIIEIEVESGGGVVKLFGVPLTKSPDDGRLTAPTSAWTELAESAVSFEEFTQQFCGSPDGETMIGMSYSSDNKQATIHRLTVDFGQQPPVGSWNTEVVANSTREMRISTTSADNLNPCSQTPSGDGPPEFTNTWTSCLTCPGDSYPEFPSDVQIFGGATTSASASVEGWNYSTNKVTGATREIIPDYVSHLIAVDYLDDGSEAKLTHEIEYTSSGTVNTVCRYQWIDGIPSGGGSWGSWSGCIDDTPSHPLRADRIGGGAGWTWILNKESSFSAEKIMATQFKVTLKVNGVDVMTLGEIDETFTWTHEDGTRTGYEIRRDPVIIDGGQDGPQDLLTSDLSCYKDYVPAEAYFRCAGKPVRTGFEYEESGNLLEMDCNYTFTYDYENWPIIPQEYEFRRLKNQLVFADIRRGLYLATLDEGSQDVSYGTGSLTNSDDTILPYKLKDLTDVTIPEGDGTSKESIELVTRAGSGYASEEVKGDPPLVWGTIRDAEPKTSQQNPVNIKPVEWFSAIGRAIPEAGVQGVTSRGEYRMLFVEMAVAEGAVEMVRSKLIDSQNNDLADPLQVYTGAPTAEQNVKVSAV